MKLTVIIPVYNEERTIEQVVRAVAAVAMDKEIVVVDDASVDRTPEILRGLEAEGLIRAFRQVPNQGKGAAVRRGIAEARGEICVIQDADLEYQPGDFPELIRPIVEYGADAVYGSRFLGPHRVFLYWHYAANRLLTWIDNVLYDTMLTDMETGYKAVRTGVLREMGLRSSTFDIEPEITAKLLRRGHRIVERPVRFQPRSRAAGKKIGWRDGVHAVGVLIRHRWP